MNDFQGTFWQELIKNVILSGSGLGLGAALYMVVYDLRRAKETVGGHVRRLWLARALFALSFVIVTGVLAQAVFTSGRPLDLGDWRVIVFTIGIIGAAFGGLGMAYESRRATEESEFRSRGRGGRDSRGPNDPRDARDARDPRRPGDPRDPRDLGDK